MVADFWRKGVGGEGSRRLVVGTLREGDFWLRDGSALALVRSRLIDRARVSYRHVQAWGWAEKDALPGSDLLILGRHNPYLQSALAEHVQALENRLKGRFVPGPRGVLGKSIAYAGATFTRHDLERGPEDHRRSDVDYAVLQMAQLSVAGEERRLVAIAGISALATMGLTLVLEDDALRRELVAQIVRTAPDGDLHPEEYLEICVRIEVRDEKHLDRFLDEPRFDFEVEAVTVAGNKEPRVRDQRVKLVLESIPGGGGTASTHGKESVRLTKGRFALLRHLVEHPDGATTAELCRTFATESQILAKRVHDLNIALQRLPQFQGRRPIRAIDRKKDDASRYKLDAQGMIRTGA
jgi:hypothetical protein